MAFPSRSPAEEGKDVAKSEKYYIREISANDDDKAVEVFYFSQVYNR